MAQPAPLGLRMKKEAAIRAISRAFADLNRKEERTRGRIDIQLELAYIVLAFLSGIRGVPIPMVPRGDSERLTRQLIDTGSIQEQGVQFTIRIADIGQGESGWNVTYSDEKIE